MAKERDWDALLQQILLEAEQRNIHQRIDSPVAHFLGSRIQEGQIVDHTLPRSRLETLRPTLRSYVVAMEQGATHRLINYDFIETNHGQAYFLETEYLVRSSDLQTGEIFPNTCILRIVSQTRDQERYDQFGIHSSIPSPIVAAGTRFALQGPLCRITAPKM